MDPTGEAISLLLEPRRSRLPRPSPLPCLLAGLFLFSVPVLVAGEAGAVGAQVGFWALLVLVPLYTMGLDLSRLLSLHRGGAADEIALSGLGIGNLAEAVAWHSARSTVRTALPLALGMLPGAAALGVYWLAVLIAWVPVSFVGVASTVCGLGLLLPVATRTHRAGGGPARARRLPVSNPFVYRELTRWLAAGDRSFRIPWNLQALVLLAGLWGWTRLEIPRRPGDVAVPALAAVLVAFLGSAFRALSSLSAEREQRMTDLLTGTRLDDWDATYGRTVAAALPALVQVGLPALVFLGLERCRVWPHAKEALEWPLLACLLLAPVSGALLGLDAARTGERREAWPRLLGSMLQIALAAGVWLSVLLLVSAVAGTDSAGSVQGLALALLLGMLTPLVPIPRRAGSTGSQAYLVLASGACAVVATNLLGPIGRDLAVLACGGSGRVAAVLLLALPGLLLLQFALGPMLQSALTGPPVRRLVVGSIAGALAGVAASLAVPLWALILWDLGSGEYTWTGFPAALAGAVAGGAAATWLPAALAGPLHWHRPLLLVAVAGLVLWASTPAPVRPDPLEEAARRHTSRPPASAGWEEIEDSRDLAQRVERLLLPAGDLGVHRRSWTVQSLRNLLLSEAVDRDEQGLSDASAELHLLALHLTSRTLGAGFRSDLSLCDYAWKSEAQHLATLLSSPRVSDERLRRFLVPPPDLRPALRRTLDEIAWTLASGDALAEVPPPASALPRPLLSWFAQRYRRQVASAYPSLTAACQVELAPRCAVVLEVPSADPAAVQALGRMLGGLAGEYRSHLNWLERHRIVAALELHRRQHGGYPATLEGLLDPAPVNHAGSSARFLYRRTSTGYELAP